MKLIKSSYKILTPINNIILEVIELAARTCYKSEEKIGSHEECPKCKKNIVPDCKICGGIGYTVSSRALVYKLMQRGHEAMLEFGPSITVKFVCDRGVSHEFVRHRLCSFAQESTRYCNYGKNEHVTFIIPEWMPDVKEGIFTGTITVPSTIPSQMWLRSMDKAGQTYNALIKEGWQPQQARSVLPNSLKTELNIKANIREWRHIFKLRTANAAHPQIRELMRPLLDEFKLKIPILFDDINY